MKKQIQPYLNSHIFINTNGATYTDSLYSITMWKPFSYVLKFQQNFMLNIRLTDNKNTLILPTFFLSDLFFRNDHISARSPKEIISKGIPRVKENKCNVWKQQFKVSTFQSTNRLSLEASSTPPLQRGEAVYGVNTMFFLKKKHINKLSFLFNSNLDSKNNLLINYDNKDNYSLGTNPFDERVCASLYSLLNFFLFKIIASHNKSLLGFWKLFSSSILKIKSLDMDTFANPIWNVTYSKTSFLNQGNRFGTFEQNSDSALSKFKKRYKT
jgi:hypothetical protein